MPIFDEPLNAPARPEFPQVEAPEAPEGSVLGAAFRTENVLVNSAGIDFGLNRPDPSFNPWEQIQGTDYEPHFEEFAGVRNASEAEQLKKRIDRENVDRQILDKAGGAGVAAQIFAGLVDAPSLIPGAQAARGASLGYNVTKNASRTARAALGEAALVEGALQNLQSTRTTEESAFAIGGSVVLGAILGAGVGAAIRRTPEGERIFKSSSRALDGNEAEVGIGLDAEVRSFEGVGADVAIKPTSEDFVNPSRVAQAAINVAPRGTTFGLSGIRAESPVAQRLFAEAIDTPFAFPGVDRLDLEPAVEVAQAVELDRARVSIGRAFQGEYNNYLKEHGKSRIAAQFNATGDALTKADFSERVAKALRRDDFDADPFVRKVAERVRNEVIEPLKEKAIKNGLLPDDVKVETAASYFTRMWDADEITRRSVEFKERLARHFDGEIRGLRAGRVEGYDITDAEVRADAEAGAEAVYNTLTAPGRIPDNLNLTVKARGPLKERTLNVRDEDFEDFLNNDAEYVLNRYARVMTADIALKERFGSADLEQQITDVANDYQRLIDEAPEGQRRVSLARERDRQLDRIEAVRDMLRGTYQIGVKNGMPYRVIQSAMTYNYVRALGSLVLSALPDVFRLAMANGVGNTWDGALKPLIKNVKQSAISRQQARDLAGIAEVELNNRLMAIADITDAVGRQTPVENALNSMGAVASKFSGATHWNDFLKGLSLQVTTARLRKLSLDGDADTAFRRRLKLNKRDAESIKKAMDKHGVEVGGIFDPRPDKWAERTREIYARALRADADTVIVTPGIGDKIPGAEHHYWLKPALQFKSFAVAAHSRVMITGVQEDQARFLSSAASMAAMGMFVYYLKSLSSGRETSDNPGTWLAEGIDRSGVFPLIMEANNWVESMGAPGVYNILSMGEDEASRYAVRNTAGRVMGPTAGLISDTAVALRAGLSQLNPAASDEARDVTSGDIGSMRRLIPFGRHPGVKELLDLWAVPNLKEMVN